MGFQINKGQVIESDFWNSIPTSESAMSKFNGLVGFVLLLGLAFFLSSDRHAVRWKIVVWGITLQVSFAFLVLKGGWLSDSLAWFPLSFFGYTVLLLFEWVLLRCLSKTQLSRLGMSPRLFQTVFGIQVLFGIVRYDLLSHFLLLMRQIVN